MKKIFQILLLVSLGLSLLLPFKKIINPKTYLFESQKGFSYFQHYWLLGLLILVFLLLSLFFKNKKIFTILFMVVSLVTYMWDIIGVVNDYGLQLLGDYFKLYQVGYYISLLILLGIGVLNLKLEK